jgi:hypothetical protein
MEVTVNQVQNKRGQWVPAIPLPFYGLRKRCDCGRKFWTTDGYRGHYALCHILSLTGHQEAR